MQSTDDDDKKMFKLKSILEMYQPSCMYITTISNGSDILQSHLFVAGTTKSNYLDFKKDL